MTPNIPTDMLKVIAAAKAGDTIAHRSLMLALHHLLEAGETPPAVLRDYAARKT